MNYFLLEGMLRSDGLIDFDPKAWAIRYLPRASDATDRRIDHFVVPRNGASHFFLDDEVRRSDIEVQRRHACDRPERIVGRDADSGGFGRCRDLPGFRQSSGMRD